jgi:plasmid stabilization system protein ParE
MASCALEINLTQPAENDLDEIYSYIFEASKETATAKKVTGKIMREIFGLGTTARLNPIMFGTNYHKLICGNYVIPYIIDEPRKTVFIMRIFHGKMDYMKVLKC